MLAVYGILIYADPKALSLISPFPPLERGILAIPALAVTVLPDWLAGLALLGIFIDGLVPAAIITMAQANLLTRNIVKPIVKLSPSGETRLAKWASVVFKFIALGCFWLVVKFKYL
ncbi:hypothetical protein [Caldivirga sp.]|uniref:hypothetical protein n=1 Tax=Caldivirga sp. TaxID=2080243 RepID=UPI0025B844E1|nr:hypothetical protein [Caldivirga sp.]